MRCTQIAHSSPAPNLRAIGTSHPRRNRQSQGGSPMFGDKPPIGAPRDAPAADVSPAILQCRELSLVAFMSTALTGPGRQRRWDAPPSSAQRRISPGMRRVRRRPPPISWESAFASGTAICMPLHANLASRLIKLAPESVVVCMASAAEHAGTRPA